MPSFTDSSFTFPIISVHSQFVFKMPSPTNGSLKLFTYPPVHKDIPTELYSAGVPLIAEKVFSLLNPADLCSCLQVSTTWNYQVSSVPKFMDKVSAHRRKCKENAENHHASKKQMEVIVFPSQRQPLATFTPNTLTQIQTKETCSTTVSLKCIKPVWQKSGCSGRVGPSKRPRQSEDICGSKKSKKRLRRLWTLRPSSYSYGEVQFALVQQICATWMELKTAVVKMTASI